MSVWSLYAAHQLLFWWVIYKAQRAGRYQSSLGRWNIAALVVNAAFVALHIAQTHLLYDGLAIDVSIWSSLASVAIMLIWILLMENDERGLAFGKRLPLPSHIISTAKKTHGYYFAWACTYTFWYHPTEGSWGHLIGFFYMFVLFVQGSLFFTPWHVNKWWRVSLEVLVVGHAAVVAAQDPTLLPMFVFGFLAIFVVTQMHGLNLSRTTRAVFAALFVAGAVVSVAVLGPEVLAEIPRIPLIDYTGVLILAVVVLAISPLVRLLPAAKG